ncbi:DUF2927 domain-containing protein [Hydrogenovibrio kuenenii]|uniref:DUF2927 domain-containing protein n=1 Tax=Hydrogenovibrio kuenenii TaxID=63658 RepID=UPI000467BDFD|nr:DUF2927 domain-containing protein [Hydrogenovibrio kuenenii]
MKKVWLALISTLLLGSANPNSWQKPAYIEKAFIEIALKNEYQASDMKISKWTKPIHYQITFLHLKPYEPVIQMIDAHLKQLQHITHHPISSAQEASLTNLKILITKDKYYQAVIDKYTGNKQPNLSTESNCMATIHKNKRHEIDRATVVIPIDYAMTKGLLPACVVEELTQIMGLPNDSNWVYPSVANDVSKVELLSGLDYIFLKLLYANEIKPGMNLTATRNIVQKLIKKYQAGGVIKRATSKVRQEGIYPLLY